jgi:hypothetical protein
MDQVPVGSGDGIPMQAQQFLRASNAGKPPSGPYLPTEDA